MPATPINILVIKPSSLGDVIHTFPAVDLIQRECPEARISWLVNDTLASVAELLPAVDEILPFRRRHFGHIRHWGEIPLFVRELRQRHYDIAIDFQGLLRSGLIARASGAPKRVGFWNAREGSRFCYTERVMLPANIKHAVERNVFLARAALGLSMDMEIPELRMHHDYVKRAKMLLEDRHLDEGWPVLAVAPAARWASKTWPPGFFAKTLDLLLSMNDAVHVWILGADDEAQLCQSVIDKCKLAKPVNLCGETNLGTLAEMLRRSDVLLTNDSGPMHMAAALRTSTVALFGPTDPDRTGPYGPGHTVFQGKCENAPCLRRECTKRDNQCFGSISAEAVARAINERLVEKKIKGEAE
ncbi:MAG: lipopolysaccharide heptosyltransferase I [Lentisphaeria bacterium]|nr:lipopolysaccharide heptosyltransferase I [Lentisphaeria bacterium]